MHCIHCGKQLRDNTVYCPFCGMQQYISSDTNTDGLHKPVKKSKKSAGTRKGLPSWLMLIIGFVAVAAITAGLIFGGVMSIRGINNQASKIEGKGFATPEDAIIAYAEALKAQDLDKLLSTFAVESLCESYDARKFMDHVKSFQYAYFETYPLAPTDNTLIERANIEKWREYILRLVNEQLLVLSNAASEGSLDKIISRDTVFFEDRSQMSDLLRNLQNLPDLSKMEIGEIVYNETIREGYIDSQYINNYIKWADIFGADGYKSLALTFSVDGMEGILFVDTVRYNGKWYNLPYSGPTGFSSGRMFIASDQEEYEETILDLLENQDQIIAQLKSELPNLKEEWEAEREVSMSFDEMMDFLSLTELME